MGGLIYPTAPVLLGVLCASRFWYSAAAEKQVTARKG